MIDAARLEAVRKVVLGRAMRAREDIVDFFDFVMRSETNNRRIKAEPHQRVMMKFALDAKDLHGFGGKSVLILPVEHSKTFCAVALTLFLLAEDPSLHGGFLSATLEQAKKPFNMVREYLETSPEIRLVNPNLRRSRVPGAPWTQTALTLDRHDISRDPTLQAFSLDSPRIIGSRLDWLVVDDVLTEENVRTNEQRSKVVSIFNNILIGRIRKGGRIIVMNSAKHPDDLLHRLDKLQGWPTLRMDAIGHVDISNSTFGYEGEACADDIEPETPSSSTCVLTAHKGVPEEERVLFPAVWSRERLESKRVAMLPGAFARDYLSICRDDESAMCKREYIDRCFDVAQELDYRDPVMSYNGPNVVFTGVDLAVKKGEKNDYTAFFVLELRPNGLRVVLNAEYGQWSAGDIVRKLFDYHRRYGGIVIVEDNGAQSFIRQMAREQRVDVPIRPHTTTAIKHHKEYGVPGIFVEFLQGAWAIPNRNGKCSKAIEKWIEECLFYEPEKHTGDLLMASYFAREQARKFKGARDASGGPARGSISTSIMSR